MSHGSPARRGAGSVVRATGPATQHRQGPCGRAPRGWHRIFPECDANANVRINQRLPRVPSPGLPLAGLRVHGGQPHQVPQQPRSLPLRRSPRPSPETPDSRRHRLGIGCPPEPTSGAHDCSRMPFLQHSCVNLPTRGIYRDYLMRPAWRRDGQKPVSTERPGSSDGQISLN